MLHRRKTKSLSTVKISHFSRQLVFVIPLILGLLYALGLLPILLLDRLDEMYYDARLIRTMPGTRDERIVIVDVDEKSLATLGRWPWNRKLLAQLTTELTQRQAARVVAFDVVFAEPDTSSGYAVLEKLTRPGGALNDARLAQSVSEQRHALDYDAMFIDALRGDRVVLGYYWTNDRDAFKSGILPKPLLSAETVNDKFVKRAGTGIKNRLLTQWDGYGSNFKPFADAAVLQGHINPFVDPEDGVVRRVPLIAEHEGKGYESLALAVFRVLLGLPQATPVGDSKDRWLPNQKLISGLQLSQSASPNAENSLTLPIDEHGLALVPFRGKPGVEGNSFRYISAADVLGGKLREKELADKVVLIGTTAPGLLDARITPVSKIHPGVEIHAHLLSGMLNDTIPTQPSYEMGYQIVLMILVTGLLALTLPKLTPLQSSLFAVGLLCALIAFNWMAYVKAGLVLPLSASVAMLLLTYLAYLAYGYFIENRTKRVLTQLFGTYVPPELVDEMAKDPEQYSLAAQSKTMTVMFCDIRGFTHLSETMSPTQLSELVNAVFSAVTEVVQTHRGTLDKYLGDAVMAFWGAPLDTANHAELAVQTALAIKPAIDALNAKYKSRNWPDISLGVGVNTGTMFVGDMGSKVRRAYTVVGDAVNLASRIEGLTRLYAVDALCGEDTQLQCPAIHWREIDTVRVKGKQNSVTLYEPMTAEQYQAQTTFTNLHAEFLRCYRRQDWRRAMALLNTYPEERETLALLFAERIERLQAAALPSDWDGTTRLGEK